MKTDKTTIIYDVTEADIGKRLDVFLAEQDEKLTRSRYQKLILDGMVVVNNTPVPKNYKLRGGDVLTVQLPEVIIGEAVPQNIPLEIIYEDNQLLVVNKPKGMVVHPAAGNWENTLVNALMFHCKEQLSGINGVVRPGILHRIDKNTSGLLVVAKTNEAHLALAKQIKEHSFTRRYEAIIIGRMPENEGVIDLPIGRHPLQRKKMTVTDKNSRNAVTLYKTISVYTGYSHIECTLKTGRTHQIRVHLSHLGHPILGDTVYGAKKSVPGLDGQCLHARTLGFVHPVTGEYMEFTSDLPEYFHLILKKIQ